MNEADTTQTPGQCPFSGEAMVLSGSDSRLDPAIAANPFPFYRALRNEKPVYYDPGLDVYLVTRYEDALTVLRDDVNFSLAHGYQDRWAGEFVGELEEIMNREGGGFIRDPAHDPPEHTRVRKLLENAFTAHRVKSLEPRIRQIVVELVEDLAERGHGDGMKDIGIPLTARIICEQLGFDYEEVGPERIALWSTALIDQAGRMQTREQFERNARAICDMQNYIIPKIREREITPGEDMISDMIQARINDPANPRLTFEELVGWVRALLVAGNDTTAAALGNLMLMLATQPGLAGQLHAAADDDRLLTRFIEEVLRLQPPTHGLFRCAMNDVEVGGTVIPAFSHVCIMYASANDDDTVFPCPRDLDPKRTNIGNHLTFGAGIHRCIGSALARMEIKVAAQEIIKRLDNIELTISREEITYLPTIATRTLERLPLTFTRRAQA